MGDFVFVCREPGEAPCPKACIKLGWWVERRVEGRDSALAEVKRPRLALGLKMNTISLISEAGWIQGRQHSTAMASRYWCVARHIIGLNAGHGIYVTSRLVNPIIGMATAWGSPMVTGLCLIQIEWRERSQASFNSRLILTQTVLRTDVICITGKKGLCLFSACVCMCVFVRGREQEQCCNWKCIVGLYMHMLKDKRSHTDQQTDRFCCTTYCCLSTYSNHSCDGISTWCDAVASPCR